MKILLTSLNAKYIQTNLALRYLYEMAAQYQSLIELKEFTINQEDEYVYNEIVRESYDIICISCYIWNIEKTIPLISDIKKANSEAIIVLGGPESSYDSKTLMQNHPAIDYIIRGEGEKTFVELLDFLIGKKKEIKEIKGLTYRENNQPVSTLERELIDDLNDIPFPYNTFLPDKDKIVYYETSRGCPFACSYCLSSTTKGVRYFPIERVKKEVRFFIDQEVPQVKFVDRTFNISSDRCLNIMEYIQKIDKGITNFHFEVNGDFLNSEIMTFLKKVRKGLFQFEIGVQSTHPKTLESICRKMDFQKLRENVVKIYKNENIHVHLDLIAGLPYENKEIFIQSFNDVYQLNPHNLQLGFLKLLKGAPIRKVIDKHQYYFRERPPYEVISNKYLSALDLVQLKMIENILDKFYNRPGFRSTIQYIIDTYYGEAYTFYDAFSAYWYQNGLQHVSHSKKKLYTILMDFCIAKGLEHIEIIKSFLLYDKKLIRKSGESKEDPLLSPKIHTLLHETDFIDHFMPHYKNEKVKEIKKHIGFQLFSYNIFEYINKHVSLISKNNLCIFDYEKKGIDECASVYCLEWDKEILE